MHRVQNLLQDNHLKLSDSDSPTPWGVHLTATEMEIASISLIFNRAGKYIVQIVDATKAQKESIPDIQGNIRIEVIGHGMKKNKWQYGVAINGDPLLSVESDGQLWGNEKGWNTDPVPTEFSPILKMLIDTRNWRSIPKFLRSEVPEDYSKLKKLETVINQIGKAAR